MEKQFPVVTASGDNIISLQQVITNLLKGSVVMASLHNTHIVNEVKQGIPLGAAMYKAIAVMKALLTTVVANSNNGEIHIKAERFRDIIILEIQERNNNNGYALSFSVNSMEQDAASAGGHISINGPQQKVTTISFSFPGNLMAA